MFLIPSVGKGGGSQEFLIEGGWGRESNLCRQTVAAVKVRSALITGPLIYNELYENLELAFSKI